MDYKFTSFWFEQFVVAAVAESADDYLNIDISPFSLKVLESEMNTSATKKRVKNKF